MPGPGNPNKTMQQDYVLGPDGKTLGFYDQFGNFIPSDASSTNANPYVAGMNTPMLQSTFSPNQTTNNMAGMMLGMGKQQQAAPPPPPPAPQAGVPTNVGNLTNKMGSMQNYDPNKFGNPHLAQDQQFVQGLENSFANAESVAIPETATTAVDEVEAGAGNMDFLGKKMNPNASSLIGLGAYATTALGQKMNAGYDQRVGMERPSFGKRMTDFQLTGMAAKTGNPFIIGGAAVADVVKNLKGFQKDKNAFNKAETKANYYGAMNNMITNRGTDFTGMAKYGMENPYMKMGGAVPAELEMDEIVFVPKGNGAYERYMETSPDAPSHEQGGVKTMLPPGAVVFPGEYKQQAEEAFMYGGKTGNWSKFNNVKTNMLARAKQAAASGQPYSSGGAMGYGGKYRDGGGVGSIVPKMPTPGNDMFSSLQYMKPLEKGTAINNAAIPTMSTTPTTTKTNSGDRNAKGGSSTLPIGSVKHTGNRGVVSGQQEMLNKMIEEARASGATGIPEALVVDDVMGAKTRAAMDYFQNKGTYSTPELLSAKNVEQYKENWKNMSAEEKRAALLAGQKAVGKKPSETATGERPKQAQKEEGTSDGTPLKTGPTNLIGGIMSGIGKFALDVASVNQFAYENKDALQKDVYGKAKGFIDDPKNERRMQLFDNSGQFIDEFKRPSAMSLADKYLGGENKDSKYLGKQEAIARYMSDRSNLSKEEKAYIESKFPEIKEQSKAIKKQAETSAEKAPYKKDDQGFPVITLDDEGNIVTPEKVKPTEQAVREAEGSRTRNLARGLQALSELGKNSNYNKQSKNTRSNLAEQMNKLAELGRYYNQNEGDGFYNYFGDYLDRSKKAFDMTRPQPILSKDVLQATGLKPVDDRGMPKEGGRLLNKDRLNTTQKHLLNVLMKKKAQGVRLTRQESDQLKKLKDIARTVYTYD